jgi:hypothetical protein
MALTQTRADILGTSASRITILSAEDSYTKAAAAAATTGVNCGMCVGLSIQINCNFGATYAAITAEVFTSFDGTTYDILEPYASYLISPAAQQLRSITIPLPYPENIPYFKVKLTSATLTNATCDCWVSYLKVTV